jgi:hypothetical protein
MAKDKQYIHKEVKSRLSSRNACYRSLQKLLTSCVVSKELKTKMYTKLRNFVSRPKRGMWIERVREQSIKGMLGCKRNKVTRKWRKLHNEELHNFYPSQNITSVQMGGGHVEQKREIRNSYKILVKNS